MTVPSISNANQAASLVGRVADLVTKGVTMGLQETIMQLREAISALREENLALKEQVSSLQQSIDLREMLTFEAPNYYLVAGDGLKDGPFCQVCQDSDKKLIRRKMRQEGSWDCGVCKGVFETPQYKAMFEARMNNAFNNSRQGEW